MIELFDGKRISMMASKINELEALFECPICMEKLGCSNKVLPCQHTFCEKCLYIIYLREYGCLRCPECRQPYKGSIEELPTNIFLVRIMDKMKEIRNDSSFMYKKVSPSTSQFEAKLNSTVSKKNLNCNINSFLSMRNSRFFSGTTVNNMHKEDQSPVSYQSPFTSSLSNSHPHQRTILVATRRITNSDVKSIFSNHQKLAN